MLRVGGNRLYLASVAITAVALVPAQLLAALEGRTRAAIEHERAGLADLAR